VTGDGKGGLEVSHNGKKGSFAHPQKRENAKREEKKKDQAQGGGGGKF